jgi:hypothetical protein
MTTRYVNFYGTEKEKHQPTPYICGQEPIEYFCDGKMGHIHFNGYYYVEDHAPPYLEDRPRRHDTWLPQKLIMFMQLVEKEPYKVEVVDNATRSYYKDLENHQYIVEIYKRVIHEKTDVISTVEDEDGDEMNVCFFPTNRQTIYFRVLGDFISDC